MGRPRKPGPRGPSHTPPAPSSPPPCQERGGDAIFPDPPSPPGDGSEDQRLLLERLAEVTGLTAGQVKRGLRFLHRDGPEAAGRKLEACPDCPRRSRYAEAGAVVHGQEELRRRLSEGALPPPTVLLHMDPARGTCTFHGQPLALTPKPFLALVLLAREAQARSGWVSTQHLHEACWREENALGIGPEEAQVSKTVCRLRRALQQVDGITATGAAKLLRSRYGFGYRLALEPHQIELR